MDNHWQRPESESHAHKYLSLGCGVHANNVKETVSSALVTIGNETEPSKCRFENESQMQVTPYLENKYVQTEKVKGINVSPQDIDLMKGWERKTDFSGTLPHFEEMCSLYDKDTNDSNSLENKSELNYNPVTILDELNKKN